MLTFFKAKTAATQPAAQSLVAMSLKQLDAELARLRADQEATRQQLADLPDHAPRRRHAARLLDARMKLVNSTAQLIALRSALEAAPPARKQLEAQEKQAAARAQEASALEADVAKRLPAARTRVDTLQGERDALTLAWDQAVASARQALTQAVDAGDETAAEAAVDRFTEGSAAETEHRRQVAKLDARLAAARSVLQSIEQETAAAAAVRAQAEQSLQAAAREVMALDVAVATLQAAAAHLRWNVETGRPATDHTRLSIGASVAMRELLGEEGSLWIDATQSAIAYCAAGLREAERVAALQSVDLASLSDTGPVAVLDPQEVEARAAARVAAEPEHRGITYPIGARA